MLIKFDVAYHNVFMCNLKVTGHDYPRSSDTGMAGRCEMGAHSKKRLGLLWQVGSLHGHSQPAPSWCLGCIVQIRLPDGKGQRWTGVTGR